MFKRCTLSIATAAVLSMLTFSAQAKHIQDSYIVVFKEPLDVKDRIVLPPKKEKIGKVKFMENTNDQDKDKLAKDLKFKGKIIYLLESMNAMYVNMTEEEAQKWERDERVAYISQSIETTGAARYTPSMVGMRDYMSGWWALDRLDSVTPALNGSYNDTLYDGSGSTIYVLDTGVSNHQKVRDEFRYKQTDGSTIDRLRLWDINASEPQNPIATNPNASGIDQNGHGTWVAIAAAGKTYGVARGANVISVRVTTGGGITPLVPSGVGSSGTEAAVFEWLANHAYRGSIVNYSRGPRADVVGDCGTSATIRNNGFARTDTALEEAVRKAYNNGIIVVVAAHNDGCDTNDFSPTNIPEAFVVGATSSVGIISAGKDVVAEYLEMNNLGKNIGFKSRYGSNISVYGPGLEVLTMNIDGSLNNYVRGTSLATAYTTGVFATACQATYPYCAQALTKDIYDKMRELGTTKGHIFNVYYDQYGGTHYYSLLHPETSRFITKTW